MDNIDMVYLVPIVVVVFIALIVLLVILNKILVNVGAREIAIKERRYFGAKMPPGRVVATEGEVGIQADVLKPGLHLIKYPFERIVRKVPLIEIGADELGIVEAVDGEPMLPGRIFVFITFLNFSFKLNRDSLFGWNAIVGLYNVNRHLSVSLPSANNKE